MFPLLAAAEADPAAPSDAASAASVKKVELDLEGAPFLVVEEDQPKSKQDAAVVTPEVSKVSKPAGKKKFFMLPAILLLFLIVGGALAAYMFFFNASAPNPSPPQTIVVSNEPAVLPDAPVPKFSLTWPYFWVELQDMEGETRFLVCRLTIITDSQQTEFELQQKSVIIRDAIYYYFINKPYAFLADTREARLMQIKNDVTNIIKEYLVTHDLKEVLLDDYIIK